MLVVSKDVGVGEFYQLYTLEAGALTLLTDGRSRNEGATWDREGNRLAYTSTRRNGTDSDIYIVDPRDPKSDRMVVSVKGNGWAMSAFAPGGKKAIVERYFSVEKSELYEFDIASGKMTRLMPECVTVAWSGATYGPDGTIYVRCDQGSDFKRLGKLANGAFVALNPETNWDIEDFAVAEDGSFIAYEINEAGVSRLRLLDPKSGRVREAKLPDGVLGGIAIAPWGEVAFTFSSAQSAGDAYSLDPATLKVRRWTASETGGLDPVSNALPELVSARSFDGIEVSGFLYRPNPAKFPGKRPMIVDIHGGPEGQFKPGFRGGENYIVNELGIAMFWPNVRGSTGFGKIFVGLDNGPYKREDSVKDIGAFLDVLAKDPGLDAAHSRSGGQLRRVHVLRLGDPLCRPLPRGAVHGGDLELRQLPRKHAKLSPRSATHRIRRRARSGPAREADQNFAAHADRRD